MVYPPPALRSPKSKKVTPRGVTVVLPGFEPGQTEPKPVVLPLHHKTLLSSGAKIGSFAGLCKRLPEKKRPARCGALASMV